MPTPVSTLRCTALAAGAALALGACSDSPTAPDSPRFHIIPVATPDLEWLALCKVGPEGTYTFSATATHPVLYDPTTSVYNQTAQSYTITVGPGSLIDVGGTSVSGACYGFTNANGDHNHVAIAGGGTDASVTVVETAIPTGVAFVKADVYQNIGGTVTLNTTATNSATGRLGGDGTGPSGVTGANIVFYNDSERTVFVAGETAVGAGTRWPGTTNWFMYTAYTTSRMDLIAGQHYVAGDIYMSRSGGGKTASTTIRIVLRAGWSWANVGDVLKIHPMDKEPKTYVEPGAFLYKFTAPNLAKATGTTVLFSGNEVTVTMPGTSAKFYGIHGDVLRQLP